MARNGFRPSTVRTQWLHLLRSLVADVKTPRKLAFCGAFLALALHVLLAAVLGAVLEALKWVGLRFLLTEPYPYRWVCIKFNHQEPTGFGFHVSIYRSGNRDILGLFNVWQPFPPRCGHLPVLLHPGAPGWAVISSRISPFFHGGLVCKPFWLYHRRKRPFSLWNPYMGV